jgi:hypothetical protein
MRKSLLISIAVLSLGILPFQNCALSDTTSALKELQKNSNELPSLVSKPGVVTILMALGDQLNDQLVVKGTSSQRIAETMVRYASPNNNPRILIVRDRGHNDETAYDSAYIATSLLARHSAVFMDEPEGGLLPEHIVGYDLIWFNNPGAPMSSAITKATLMNFAGGVILSGDDMSRGINFDLSDLTGLTYVDNGTSVECNGNSYAHDNNSGLQYSVGIDPAKMPDAGTDILNFNYGNDIDNTLIAASNVEVIALAKGGADDCVEQRPAIVRREKN